MAKTDILKNAIADLEEIQKASLEHARQTLNETFDSTLKKMLSAKLNEEADEEEKDEEEMDEAKMKDEKEEEMDEAKAEDETEETDEAAKEDESEEEMDEEIDIEAILAEMEADEEETDEVVSEESDEAETEEEEKEEESEEDADESFDLNALLQELKGEEKDEEEMDEASVLSDPNLWGGISALVIAGGSILAGLRNDLKKAKTEEEKKKVIQNAVKDMESKKNEETEEIDEFEQLQEMKKKLNETNLLNAKLLYLNKVLAAHELTEGQKVQLINSFDEATTVKEVKLVHKTISEAFKVKESKTKKTQLKESATSFASKATGTASNKMDKIVEDTVVSRWQFLAGIKK